MRDRGLILAVLTIALLVAVSACGSAAIDGEQLAAAVDEPADEAADEGSGDGAQDSGATDETVADTNTGTGTEEGAANDGDEATLDNLLPTSTDPCTEPVDFSAIASDLTGDGYATAFMARSEARPLEVRFSSADAPTAEDAAMVVMLHGAGGRNEWSESMWDRSFLPELARHRPLITVMAQAEPDAPAFWAQDATFNVDYLATLNATLAESFCLQRMTIVLHGHGQGTIAALQGYCTGAFPVDALVLFEGMVKLLDCPADPRPLITFDVYEFDPIIGAFWDGSWNPPVPSEVAATGGIQSTPEDLDHWAAQFGCEGDPVETLVPLDQGSGGSEASRPVTVLAVRDCAQPIVAIGAPSAGEWRSDAPFKVNAGVLDLINTLMLDELTAALG